MEINSQCYYAGSLTYLLWLLPSLEKAIGANPAYWHWDLIPWALLWWQGQSFDAPDVGCVETQHGLKQRLSTTVLSSPLSFHERTKVPFVTYVASLFPIDEEVKSKQNFWYCYHLVTSMEAGNQVQRQFGVHFRAVLIFWLPVEITARSNFKRDSINMAREANLHG